MNSDARRYHLIALGDLDEASAFVAALSRFLSSPGGAEYLDPPRAVEVWSRVVPERGTVNIYLSDRALEAASAAFAPVAVVTTSAADLLSPEPRLLFSGDRAPAWGLTEARRHLTAPVPSTSPAGTAPRSPPPAPSTPP
jgi:hypothetical protein